MVTKEEPASKKRKVEAARLHAGSSSPGSDEEAAKGRLEELPLAGPLKSLNSTASSLPSSLPSSSVSSVKGENSYLESVSTHPFYDNSHSVLDVYSDGVFRDAKGTIVGMIFRNAIPEKAAAAAADVLRPAATKTSLRSNIYGGEAPHSGIAGYFDYRGSPIQYKSRKTSFTHVHANAWPGVFPVVDYVNEMYKRFMPEHWAAQNACIPDIVRIHRSVFSTLTINSRFRTASHTDAGDFDGGYSCISCLEGEFRGLALTFDKFKICFHMRPRDLVIFKPHHFHSNTELEDLAGPSNSAWSRITCVFYYRSQLGEPWSYAEYQRRLSAALKMNLNPVVREIVPKDNGIHLNRPAVAYAEPFTPFILPCCVQPLRPCARKALRVHQLLLAKAEVKVEEEKEGQQTPLAVLLFGEGLSTPNGIPERCLKEKMSAIAAIPAYSSDNFSEQFVENPEKAKEALREVFLSSSIPTELFKIWKETKQQFLDLVHEEWVAQYHRDPERVKFTWNNRSEMSRLFFELCDVAKEVLLAMCETETVSKSCETCFWGGLALYLNELSHRELNMPLEALSVQKLHVKLKDYHFGGTRYFKDMPPEEQRRRLERRKRLEEARRSGKKEDSGEEEGKKSKEWLENDTFDYQTEDAEVDYAGLGLPLPAENTQRFQHFSTEQVPPAETEETIYITIVLPRGSLQGNSAEKRKHFQRVKNIRAQAQHLLSVDENPEYVRLLGNKAAQELLQKEGGAASVIAEGCRRSARSHSDGEGLAPTGGAPRSGTSRKSRGVREKVEGAVQGASSSSSSSSSSSPFCTHTVANLSLAFIYAGDLIPPTSDFVVLQHVLSTLSETEAKALVHEVSHSMKPEGYLMVMDTDFLCRNYYTILPSLRELYTQAAPVSYGMLHAVRYGTNFLTIRSRHQMEALLECFTSRFKFSGSPLNSLLYVVPAGA